MFPNKKINIWPLPNPLSKLEFPTETWEGGHSGKSNVKLSFNFYLVGSWALFLISPATHPPMKVYLDFIFNYNASRLHLNCNPNLNPHLNLNLNLN